jgi:hypothetical protein
MKNINDDVKKILILFVIVKIAILFVGVLGYNFVDFSENYYEESYVYMDYKTAPLISVWAHWDGQWYMKIAENGYKIMGNELDKFGVAFFPLYPIVMSILLLVIKNPHIAGLIVSYLASFFALLFLYRLLREEFGSKISERTIFYYLIFPSAMFLSAVYSESLFLLLTVLVFYFARKKLWLYAGLVGVLASLTKLIGVIVFIPLLIEYILVKKEEIGEKWWTGIDFKIVYCFLPGLGTLMYFTYLWKLTGSFFAYFLAEQLWGREPFSFHTFIEIFQNLALHGYKNSIIDLTFALVFLGMLFFMYKRLRLSYVVYAALLILIPISSGSLLCFSRLVLMSFPHFIMFAMLGEDKNVHYGLSIVFSVLLAIFTVMFVNHYWVG